MDPRLQELIDHHEIRRTLVDYCHGCDRCDEALMASVYLEDSWDDHGRIKGPGAQFTREMIADIQQRTVTLSHLLGQSMIRINGDEAGAETYFLAVTRNADGAGFTCHQLGGRYVDRLWREGGRWLIKHRDVIRDWSISLPVERDWMAESGLKDGFRSNEDASYAALGLSHSGGRGRS